MPVLILVLIAVACAGDSENPNRVLELSKGLITEEDFRAGIRAADRRDPSDVGRLCEFSVLSEDADAVALAVDLIFGNATATAAPVPADMERAAEIIREECARRRNI